MIGIILAGGNGSRLNPSTKAMSKHLLPVYDKPMIYYPLTTLMFAGARKIFIIVSPEFIKIYKKLMGNGRQWGIELTYLVQELPLGIADCFNLIPESYREESCVVILGDNFFFGMGFGENLKNLHSGRGATCLAYQVADPSNYGVVEFNEKNEVTGIEEKPEISTSEWAIPGLYWFDSDCYEYAKLLVSSHRGELEITELLKIYLKNRNLFVRKVPRGTTWMDAGTPDNLLETSNFVSVVEKRQGLKIGCPEEVALRENLIDLKEYQNTLSQMPQSSYRDYLENLF